VRITSRTNHLALWTKAIALLMKLPYVERRQALLELDTAIDEATCQVITQHRQQLQLAIID